MLNMYATTQAVLVVLLIHSRGGSAQNNVCGGPRNNNSDEQVVIKAVADFNGASHRASRSGDLSSNLVLSPLSLATVLALVSAGAGGKTQTQIQSALSLPQDQCQIRSGFNQLLAQLNKTSGVILKVFDAVYVDRSSSVQQSFITVAHQYYSANVTQEDFRTNPSAAIVDINDWVEQATNGTITDIVGPDTVTSDTRLVLVNAIYFKGAWKVPFNPSLTTRDRFYSDNTTFTKVPTMHTIGHFLYSDNKGLQSHILALNYQGENVKLVIVLPYQRDGLDNFETLLNTIDQLQLGNLKDTYVNVSLPKFTITMFQELTPLLKQLGMTDAFSSAANFSGISNSTDLKISSVVQRAYIKVDENGTEAAAATAVAISTRLVVVTTPEAVQFNADHPFAFVLLHSPTNTVLFIGRVVRPVV
uniref:Serpin domain-containing protein n=1 Tax=Timema douglasi TaxID=61478 RepID=A0A7R8VPF9_TIMDO|nr:unnamed protein product [Timema douglasi]